MAYLVSGTDLTSVANAIRTAGETSAPLEFPSGFVTAIGNISGGGGGATNVVTGTFTASAAEKGTAKAISVPYTGSGYPVSVHIYPTGGTFNSQSDMYSVAQYKAIVDYTATKNNTGTTPDYVTSTDEKNKGSVVCLYKNSNSDATNIANTGNKSVVICTGYSANGNDAPNCVRFSSATSMGVFIANTDYYGFKDGIEYTYQIVYSA